MTEQTQGGGQLTQEQLDRIAKNREEALKRLQARNERIALEMRQKSTASSGTAVSISGGPQALVSNQSNGSSWTSNRPSTSAQAYGSNQWIRKPTVPASRPSTGVGYSGGAQALISVRSNGDTNAVPRVQAPLNLQQYTPTVDIQLIVINLFRFKITWKQYSQAVVDVLKTMPSRAYDEHTKIWSFGFRDYNLLVAKLHQIKSAKIKLDELPAGVRRAFADEMEGRLDSAVIQADNLTNIEDTLVQTLFPFQKIGVSFGINRNGRILLADEMGLGKSIQALAIARHFRDEWPLLIVCPSSVKYAWKTQIEKFLPSIKAYDIHMIEKKSDFIPKKRSTSTIIIVSYDIMSSRLPEFEAASFYVLIFDESHFLKECKSKRTKAATALSKRANRTILLSGTPALSRPIELFSQIRIIDPNLFTNIKQFGERYCDAKPCRFKGKFIEYRGATNMDELSAVLQQTIMVRRLKKDVLDDLPEKRREIIYLTGDSIDHKMKSLKDARDACLKSKKGKESKETLMRYYTETAIVKSQSVGEHIVESYFYDGAPTRKMLIFAHHNVVLDTISMMLTRKGVKFIRIDGSVNQSHRAVMCNQFQTDPNMTLALLSITAAGVGITLTAASHIVFAEIYWNPGTMMQAEDRAHRVGQKNPVTIQYMLAKHTADDEIWPLIAQKLRILDGVKLSSDNYRDADKIHRDCTSRDITSFFEKMNDENDEPQKEDEPSSKRNKPGYKETISIV
ncbi:hepA-related protein (HARP) domain-containing protein [Ditylenchus destructor]|nr:hepA-related protein (HARP) domain-containing protein [Ditylenchus destructor]